MRVLFLDYGWWNKAEECVCAVADIFTTMKAPTVLVLLLCASAPAAIVILKEAQGERIREQEPRILLWEGLASPCVPVEYIFPPAFTDVQ